MERRVFVAAMVTVIAGSPRAAAQETGRAWRIGLIGEGARRTEPTTRCFGLPPVQPPWAVGCSFTTRLPQQVMSLKLMARWSDGPRQTRSRFRPCRLARQQEHYLMPFQLLRESASRS